MIKLETFKGHIVLYCKGHYQIKNDEFFEGLKMIWAIRCGYEYEQCSFDVLRFIANDMYEIISECMPERLNYVQRLIHEELSKGASWKPLDMTAIESIVWEYRSLLSNLQIREKVNVNYRTLIKLPKRQPRIFNRILKGNGKYDDYHTITNRDKEHFRPKLF